LCFTHGAFLGNQSVENSEFVTRELGKCLSQDEADVARLEYVDKGSALFGSVTAIPGFFCRDHFAPAHPHGCLRLPDSFQELLRGLSRKERHNLKRYEGRVKGDFPEKMRIQTFREENQVDDLMRDTEEVAKKTYQRALGVGFHDDLETRQLLRTAAQKRCLRGSILYLEDHPSAFMIGVQYRQALHGTAMGYDPGLNNYSLGSLLLMHWIEDAFDTAGSQKVAEIDLGPGDGRFKRTLHNHVWNESIIYICAPTVRGIVFNFQRTLTYLLDQSARRLVLSPAFLEKVKKIWRSRARGTTQTPDSHSIRTVRYSDSIHSSD
jgi:CelD/BcsL family acetyltransferase involved in cellulose biosynthesis